MSLDNKNYIIDPNGWEKLKIEPKEELQNLEKKVVPWFLAIKKIASAMLTTAILSANNIDTSKLPHYAFNLWKYIAVKVERGNVRNGDYSQAYDTWYYERYNKKAKHLESSSYRENIDISNHIVWWYMKFYWHKYKLVNFKKVSPSYKFLKSEELDKVVININWKTYVTKPKFLQLDFEAVWRKWYAVYGMWKNMALVYVPYKDHILVLGSVVDGSYYEEDKHKTYDVSAYREKYMKELKSILNLFWCNYNNCDIKKDYEWNKYFYKNWKLAWKIENFWDKKLIIKWKKLVWKILKKWNREIIIGNNWEIISEFPWFKQVRIKLNQTDMDMSLYVK